jgi:hypothetical protein
LQNHAELFLIERRAASRRSTLIGGSWTRYSWAVLPESCLSARENTIERWSICDRLKCAGLTHMLGSLPDSASS